jgi:hypothetical protein
MYFKTGEKLHYNLLITELNSNADGGDFSKRESEPVTTLFIAGACC